MGGVHDETPGFVCLLEFVAFFGEFFVDVFGLEDGLEVLPEFLGFYPEFYVFLHLLQLLTPFGDVGFHEFDERGGSYGEDFGYVFVEFIDDWVDGFYYVGFAVFVG